ncbi:MAG: efflux RND transporter permease subunit [Clostridiales bacterium]|nr:efflux RND transporter permease subunit [Clostridiales bacterium]
MKIPEYSVNRRVTTSMVAMILVVVGFIAFSRLGLDLFPDIEYPTVSVITSYRGASSEDIEKTITKPVEQIISSVNRVKKVSSNTMEGASVIMVEFEWGTNLDFAAQDIRDQVGLYKAYLPAEASDPLVVKFNLAMMPIIFYGITANMPTVELQKLIEDDVAPRLERIDGVASARVFSTEVREILVGINKASLEARNLSLDRVLAALALESVNLPAGYVVERHADYLVRTLGEFESLQDIGRVVIGNTATGEPIFLADIAEIKDTMKETRYVGRIQKQQGVFLIVNKRSGANTAIAGNEVKKELEKIKRILPPDIEFFVAMDQSEMITRVASRTASNAVQGGILAILLIFLFLRNWRPTLTIAIAVPLSVITTFIAFYLAGYTLNLLTLGGLTLGVGMLVDNAIVVIENTFRHIEEGRDRKKAAILGASEVGMAITASTLTTIVVFFPVVFAQGITGKLTRGLALAIAFSLLSSLFVALTIVPMLSSFLFRPRSANNPSQTMDPKVEGDRRQKRFQFEKTRELYRGWLSRALQRRWWVLGGALGVFVLSLAIVPFLGTEFMPNMDQGMILLKVKMPIGTALEETNRVLTLVENLMMQQPEIKIVTAQAGSGAEEDPSDTASSFSNAGPHEGILWVGLVNQKHRNLSDAEILEKIRRMLPRLENVKFEAIDMSQMMTGAQSPVEIKIFGKELAIMKEIGDSIVARIQDIEGLRDVTHSLSQGKPEYQIKVDRERVAKLGLMVSQVANAVQTATLGRVATRYREESEEIDVRVRFQEEYRNSLAEIASIPLVTPLNKVVYLNQVATITKGEGPIQITRESQSRRISVTANIAGRDLGSVVRDIKKRIAPVEKQLPSGYFLEFGGAYEQMQEAFLVLAGAFALAVLLTYMVMASQFESFRHPFIIMFTIPLALIGVVLALLVSGRSINLPVLIGVVLLAGIAVNNGIVMIDYINQLRRRGVAAAEAVVQGAVTRLRAVLLTALSTILGMLPMALSTSEGAEMRAPMAIAVVGGLAATTFLTLFVIPIIYSLFEKISFRKAA